MENILFSIIGKLAEFTVEPIGRELGYPCFMSSNIEKLKSQVEMLKETKDSVQDMVDAATRNVEDIKPAVLKWLKEVDEIIKRSEVIVNARQQDGLCFNLVQRRKLSKKAKKMAEELPGMKEEAGNFNNGVSYNAHVTVGNSLTQKPEKDFMYFESRKSIMDQIMDALFDNSVNMIGVYGMGGVGKTTLVKEISRTIMEKKSFDKVITLEVSRTPDLKNIQLLLVDMLGLELKEETVQGRALKVRKRLEKETSILIVFDDIWEHINLETIGIPIVADDTRCKLLFTSRDKDVLSNEMSIDKNFEIKVIKEDESWNLFKKIVGDIIETYDLKPIAIQIVKECAHLPIAITVVAKALRNKQATEWKDALNNLKNGVPENIRGMKKEVYSSLKFSYDYLQGKEVKLLFLLCSMFPEDFHIKVEDLHIYPMAMGFLHGVENVEQGRCRVTKLVNDLISSSLLLQSEDGDTYVKMHDLVRDVAMLITSDDDQIRTLSYVNRSEEWEEEKLSGNHTAVYLDVKGLHSLPQKLMLPKVQLLMLQLCESVFERRHELAPTFFEETKEVKGLELKFMKVSIFPSSLDSFANVRLLHLIGCELGNIDMIGELRKLEILSFKGSNIIQIPLEISQLTQLKVLNLSYCRQLQIIPPNILSRLTKLEELYLRTFNGWEGEELNQERKNASLLELRYLPRLSRLSLWIQDEKIMPKQLFSRELNLERFNISIGSQTRNEYDFSRRLSLEMESGSCLDDWIKIALKRSEELHLVGSIGARVLPFELDENESSHLKLLHLLNNREFQHLIHQQNKPLRKFLSNLELLELYKLENLESIIHGHGHVTELPFNKLRRVIVDDCDKMRTLFYNCNFDDILNLEKISIWKCEMLEYLITAKMESEETAATIEFPHLKSLSLKSVPEVRGFCSKMDQISNESSFFSEEVLLPNLENLTITWADNLKMIWHNIIVPNSFSKLERVEIESCNNLEKVFPPNITSILTCLKSLIIKDCNLLKCIFEVQESNMTEKSNDLLSNLSHLELYNLPSLEYVWSKDSCELLIFENIKVLSIKECHKLKRAYPIKFLKQQEQLGIDFNQLKETLEKEKLSVHSNQFQTFQAAGTTQLQDGLELFSKLKSLELYGSFDYNSTHLPIEIVRILHNLGRFVARRMLIEEIFPNERLMNVEEQKTNIRFEPLQLYLFELPKLTHFWKDEFESSSSLRKLHLLSISGCGILDMLVPSSVSFTNLNNLTLDKCHRLTHLLSPSVAKTLVQLTWLCLKECKRMTTIIAREVVEEGNDEIVFHKLTNLELGDLSKLTSFHSGKCTIRFPCLRRVDIKSCPEMKAFSPGITSTPKLLVGNINMEGSFSRYGSGSNGHVNTEVVEDINDIIRQAWEGRL